MPFFDFWSAYREDAAVLVVQHVLIVAWALPLAAGQAKDLRDG